MMSEEDAARDNRLDSNDFLDYKLSSESDDDPMQANCDTVSSVFGPYNSSHHGSVGLMEEIEQDPNAEFYNN